MIDKKTGARYNARQVALVELRSIGCYATPRLAVAT